jgi:branched-subunit amino acid transport protein AzlD
MFFFFEYILVALLIVATYFLRSFPSGWFQAAEKHLSRLARRRALAVLVVGILALAIRAALLPNLPVPKPGLHNDFGNLLAADTFAHGRLANPTHPMWIYFESIHINQKPTYMPMFYAGQGLVMALGQVIAGNPWIGVWLSAGAMCAAICWMLQGWLQPGWALLGGLLAIMRLATFTYWVNSYSGGALPALGGALVLGAIIRIKRRRRLREAVLLGLGLALLANTRPYESLFFGIPIGVAALVWILGKKRPPGRELISRVVLPLGLILAVTVAGMGYFFWRVTGSPFRLPCQVNLDTYIAVPYFPWQPLNLKHEYHHWVLEAFYLHSWPMGFYYQARRAPFDVLATKASDFYRFFLGPVLALPLVVMLVISPRQFFRKSITGKTGFLVAVCGSTFIGLALPIYFIPHYAAPITAAIYALILQALRYLRLWRWRGKRAGLGLVRGIPAICVLLFLLRAAAPQLHIPTPVEWSHTWESEHFQNLDRAKALAQLEALPGDQLVMVRYNRYHSTANEWVYNRADIDTARIVWARDMGDSGNAELLRYFPQRRVWLAEPDLAPPRLSPYPGVDYRQGGRP